MRIRLKSLYRATVNCLTTGESVPRVPRGSSRGRDRVAQVLPRQRYTGGIKTRTGRFRSLNREEVPHPGLLLLPEVSENNRWRAYWETVSDYLREREKMMLEKYFSLASRQTDVKTEVLAGITTFMTMAYILFVNPSILGSAGMDKNAVLLATAIGAGLVTIMMGLFVNYPIALAPGMGLNAFYAFTVVIGMGVSWQVALGAVFISGLIFILLTVTQVRQLLVEGMPDRKSVV